MKKKIFLRCISGFPTGIAIGYLISIMISLILADGYYSPCVPELARKMGNEINAVLLQTLLCGILGMGFGGCSVIWEIEHWGLVKQTGIYFLIISVLMLPVAYTARWMEHSLKGFLSYYGIFIFIFACVWVIQYIKAKHSVKKINEILSKRQESNNE